jgi:hypothetical protein
MDCGYVEGKAKCEEDAFILINSSLINEYTLTGHSSTANQTSAVNLLLKLIFQEIWEQSCSRATQTLSAHMKTVNDCTEDRRKFVSSQENGFQQQQKRLMYQSHK